MDMGDFVPDAEIAITEGEKSVQILPGAPTRVWGYEGEGNLVLARGLMSRLRAKLELNPKDPRYILTVPGVGYVLANPRE